MMFTRMIGDAVVSNIIEYSGPTHDPDFLTPALPQGAIETNLGWLAPNHWNTRIQKFIVTIQIWVVRAGSSVIVIDTGVGNRKTRKAPRMHQLNTLVPVWLAAAGAGPNEVTHVVHTHMHTDHVGWDSELHGDVWKPTFPNARYLYPKSDFDRIKDDYDTGRMSPDAAGVFEDSILPVIRAGLVELLAPDARDVAGCLDAEPLPGHTPGMLSFRLRSNGEEGIFTGDVMHSPIQIAYPDIGTRFDELPELGPATRRLFLNRAADRNALFMPCHFGAPYCGRVRREGEGFAFVPEHG